MTAILGKIYDHQRSDSLAANLRKKRLALFRELMTSIPQPLKILDVGGRERFWQSAGFLDREMRNIKITLININPREAQATHPNVKSVVGDARKMKFEDNEFDVVFSNSVIEHVGNYNAQLQMAQEVMRVGKRYFVQTPNLYFPIEPHFVFPCFQFLPLKLRAWLMSHFDLGWHKRIVDKQEAMELVSSVRLLRKKEVLALFPNANLFEEKFFGLTKSFTVYGGWDTK